LATVLGSGVAFLDTTVVNVALSQLGYSLGASVAGLQWTVDGYLLSLTALLLIGGALGDRYGRRRIFLIGLGWFAITSALCALAPSITVLVAARVLQGVGAAMLTPGSLAIIRSSFIEEEQPTAFGAWAGLSGVATALGPLVGGWIVVAISWRMIFLINLPLAAGAMWATIRCVPKTRQPSPAPLDLWGGLLALVGLGGITWGLIDLPRPISFAALGFGAAGLAGFIVREARCLQPMLPLEVFRSRQFSGANVTTLALYFALGGTTFLFVLYLQRVLGYSALAAGAALTPVTLLLLVLSPLVGRLSSRLGYRSPMTIGPLIAGVGLLLLSLIRPGTHYLVALPGIVTLGIGLGLTVAPLTSAVLSGAESRFAGVASGVNNAIARLATLLAVALLPLFGRKQGVTSLALAFPAALRICSLLCVLGAIASYLTQPASERLRADRARARHRVPSRGSPQQVRP
jgi:EmrB/QacA subfamily drug resistance transporter